MKQPRDKNGRFTKVARVTGERNLTSSNDNFCSERSNFNISKVESNSGNLVCYIAILVSFLLNICVMAYGIYYLKSIESEIKSRTSQFEAKIEEDLSSQYQVLSSYILNS